MPILRNALCFLMLPMALLISTPGVLDAQRNCQTGKPCGNTCIARTKTCRVGTGTARSAPAARSTTRTVPAGAVYAGSRLGTTYYWVGCSAWHSLSSANLVFFATREEAVAAGYIASAQQGCSGPVSARPSSADTAEARTSFARPSTEQCEVVRVVDGDTLDCTDGRRIRLLLIDAPETTQAPFGALAKAALERIAPDGALFSVELDVQTTDRYGRTLAYLSTAQGMSVNQRMLELGMAVVSIYQPNVKHLDRYRVASASARVGKRGLWALDAFDCLPADHRAGRCGRG